MLPTIIYKEIDDTIFLRVIFSAREMDETQKYEKFHMNTKISITF